MIVRRHIGPAVLLAVVLLLAGCSDGGKSSGAALPAGSPAAGPSAAGSPAGNPLRQGPPAAWTMRLPTGDHVVVVIGDVAVVAGGDAIVGLDRRTGRRQWTRPAGGKDRIIATSDAVVQYNDKGIAVFDTVTGSDRWQVSLPGGHFQVYRTAVYADDCGTGKDAGCTVTARDVHTGRTQWTLAVHSGFRDAVTSVARPYAPPVPKYLVAHVGTSAALVDTATGKALPGRVKPGAWYVLPAGDTMVVTDNDAADCSVTLTAFDGRTSAQRWTGSVHSGRRGGNECLHFLADQRSGRETIGAGTKLAACDPSGKPVVVDLSSGVTAWAAADPGTPVDGDATGLLTLDTAGKGGLAFYDLATGSQQWKAPDPGLEFTSASWASAVTGKRVAVTGASGDHPFVVVLDRADGRQLGRFPSWLAGAGDDWVAVTHGAPGAAGELELEFVPL